MGSNSATKSSILKLLRRHAVMCRDVQLTGQANSLFRVAVLRSEGLAVASGGLPRRVMFVSRLRCAWRCLLPLFRQLRDVVYTYIEAGITLYKQEFLEKPEGFNDTTSADIKTVIVNHEVLA